MDTTNQIAQLIEAISTQKASTGSELGPSMVMITTIVIGAIPGFLMSLFAFLKSSRLEAIAAQHAANLAEAKVAYDAQVKEVEKIAVAVNGGAHVAAEEIRNLRKEVLELSKLNAASKERESVAVVAAAVAAAAPVTGMSDASKAAQ